MSMNNSQSNQAPRFQVDSESANRRFEEERLAPNIDATVNPRDVLCGRGKSSFTHVGNRRFRDAITSSIDEYNESESRLAKSRVVQRIVENITAEGGRFLKRDRANGGWTELDTKSCRDKVGHAIRDAANLIEARKVKKQRRKDSISTVQDKTTGALVGNNAGGGEESKMPPVYEESKLSSRYDEEGIFYQTFTEGKQAERGDRRNTDRDPRRQDDPFLSHINQVLGPIAPQEREARDPLREFLDSI